MRASDDDACENSTNLRVAEAVLPRGLWGPLARGAPARRCATEWTKCSTRR